MPFNTPDERLDHARNRFGHCRQQITRLQENASQRAALALCDEGLHMLATLPKYPPAVPGEASIFFEGATLEQAVGVVLEAMLPEGDVPEQAAIDAVVSRLAGNFSDAELALLSGQVHGQIKPPASQAGLPKTPTFRGILGKGRPA